MQPFLHLLNINDLKNVLLMIQILQNTNTIKLQNTNQRVKDRKCNKEKR